ncbi:MAG: DUF1800 family protein, partial [Flavobacteriaceae bacterium]|nr:DUF1800 family protein [Flavobacteriaceae bacterium]
MELKHVRHFYNRFGFGLITNSRNHKLEEFSREKLAEAFFEASSELTPLQIATGELEKYIEKNAMADRKTLRNLIKKSNGLIRDYNYAWLERMGNTEALLREKMTLFWANHFVCRDNNIVHLQQYNNILREHAFGDF